MPVPYLGASLLLLRFNSPSGSYSRHQSTRNRGSGEAGELGG